MRGMSVHYDGNVIVGMDTGDDAGVYRISESTALIQTVDFITPIIDDPHTFGRIAACNSLSDVYAMGGRPLTALNIVCFPSGKFTLDILIDILKGALTVLAEAETQLLGGHSVNDPEMKFGLAVTGIVHPDRVVRNDTIKEGDAIVLTKPVGTGVIATSLKAGVADQSLLQPFVKSMTTLNRKASEIMLKHNPHACTDVTGFGLIGHLREMLGKNAMTIIIDSKKVPVLPGSPDVAANGLIPAGMHANRQFIGGLCSIEKSVPQEIADLLFDPQTSGGLLIALEERNADFFCDDARKNGIDAKIIANVKESPSPGIRIV
jgi:selenide,water dikinase